MGFGQRLAIIAPLEVEVFVKETSSSLSDADFGGLEKLKNLKFFPKSFRFDPNVYNDSKHIFNNCFGSEKLFIIKTKEVSQ